MKVYISGKSWTLTPKRSIGKGGEADIFKLGKNKSLKSLSQLITLITRVFR